jgi:hypothetical protein
MVVVDVQRQLVGVKRPLGPGRRECELLGKQPARCEKSRPSGDGAQERAPARSGGVKIHEKNLLLCESSSI